MQENNCNNPKQGLKEWLYSCLAHLGRTKKIGENLISTSTIQSCIQESYKNIGQAVYEEVRSGRWQVPECSTGSIRKSIERIDALNRDLEELERKLAEIKNKRVE